jgi:hypothetical protein
MDNGWYGIHERRTMNNREAPEDIVETLQRYVTHRVHTGGFLHAVLANDLRESFARADDVNRHCLFEIVSYCYNNIPSKCWGSYEAVDDWLKGE